MNDWLKYQRELLMAAWRATRGIIEPWKQVAIAIGATGLAVLWKYLLDGLDSAWDLLESALIGAGALLAIWVAAFLFNREMTPFRFWLRDRDEKATLQRQLAVRQASTALAKRLEKAYRVGVSLPDGLSSLERERWFESTSKLLEEAGSDERFMFQSIVNPQGDAFLNPYLNLATNDEHAARLKKLRLIIGRCYAHAEARGTNVDEI